MELSSLFFTLPVEVCTWMQLQKDCANKLNILMPTCCEENHLNWEKMQWRDWDSNINILPENPNTSEQEHYNDGWQALGDLFLKEVQVQPRFDVQDDSPHRLSCLERDRAVKRSHNIGDTFRKTCNCTSTHPPTHGHHKELFLWINWAPVAPPAGYVWIF